MKRSRLQRKKSRRDWRKMTDDAHTNSRGKCEWCGKRVAYGTPPAHIIPRSAVGESSDDAWNLSSLCLIGGICHSKFDLNRAKAVRKMRAQGGTPLTKRIDADPRLKAYFDKKESRQQYLDDTERMNA